MQVVRNIRTIIKVYVDSTFTIKRYSDSFAFYSIICFTDFT